MFVHPSASKGSENKSMAKKTFTICIKVLSKEIPPMSGLFRIERCVMLILQLSRHVTGS